MMVHLTWYELAMAAQVGMRRHVAALMQQRRDAHGHNGRDGWSTHIEGAAGEMAVAKGLNKFYDGSVNTFHLGGDVGALQVRTRSEPQYDLLVRENDRDEDIFVLVTGRAPVFEVVGWMRGADAKQPTFRQTYAGREAAFFVPRQYLAPMAALAR